MSIEAGKPFFHRVSCGDFERLHIARVPLAGQNEMFNILKTWRNETILFPFPNATALRAAA
jgi:hypothetical protein